MRKFFSILITFVLLFNIGGYYLWFSALQYNIQREIKREIRKGLKEKDLSLITISTNDESKLTWIKPNKEFRYNGEMYDMVKLKKQNQKKLYYCIKDTKEKLLIANYNKAHKSKKNTDKKIKRIFNNNYFPQQLFSQSDIYTTEFKYTKLVFLYKINAFDLHSPPPKLA